LSAAVDKREGGGRLAAAFFLVVAFLVVAFLVVA